MPPATPVRTPEDVDAMLAASYARPVVLLKHSATCGGSHRALAQLDLLAAPGDPPRYLVVVQDARRASDAVAERLGVRHESPQALVIHEGAAVLCQIHVAIDADRLREAAHLGF